MAELTHHDKEPLFRDICVTASEIQTRQIELNDLWQSLREGYSDFDLNFGSFSIIFFFYFLSAAVIVLLSTGQELRYLAFPIVAGFNLIGPIVATGFFEMSRLREKGQKPSWRESFGFIHTHSFAPVLALSLLMMVIYVAWLYMAELIYFSTFGDFAPASVGDFLAQLFSTLQGRALIVYGNLVGFLFAFAALAISVVAFPLALDKPVTSITAIRVSISAVMANFYVMAVWGLVVISLLLLGAAFFLIGLAITLPILGHATWHLYRKLIVA